MISIIFLLSFLAATSAHSQLISCTCDPSGGIIDKNKQGGKRYYNLSPCKSIATLRDECGNVVKGVCEINTPYTYEDAIQVCRNYGMDLFIAETTTIYNAFIQYIEGQFGKHYCGKVWSPACGLWIGGKTSYAWSRVKDWETVPMNIDPYSSNFVQAASPGDCIAVTNVNGFKVTKYNCAELYGPICEFDSKL